MLAALAARVFAGDADAPLLMLAVVFSPLVALLGPSSVHVSAPRGAVAGFALASVALVLAANVLLIADLGRQLGAGAVSAVAVACTLAFAVALPRYRLLGVAASALAIAAVFLALAAIAASLGVTPWRAWTQVATRLSLSFDDRSPWVTVGGRLDTPTTLAFTESHHVTAMSPGVFRVLEPDGRGVTAREWRLSAGDSLTLRPGDRLVLGAGAHVRFERGKRVPGVPVSGAAWADPPERQRFATLLEFLGLAVTFLGGAVVLVRLHVPPGRVGALVAPVLLLGFGLAAVCWGVYAVRLAPDLALGIHPLTPVLGLGVAGAHAGPPRPLVAVVVMAVAALFCAAARGLAERVEALVTAWAPSATDGWTPRSRSLAVWAALLAVAGVATRWPLSPWATLLAGLGVGAVVGLASLVAGPDRRAALAGCVVGVPVLLVLAGAAPWMSASLEVLGRYPALAAGPLACAVARVAASVRG